ncbi:hypothetical protein ES288_D08G141500v1 [Gossypium darwinii]|uniref:Uncharacterized protein n=1 Tax=Gossypium darwinii TaxID=34276 RepID=A0A5D2BJE4_GOSDA|nr:hypothetical protein ES288_D08G141500v1 [Gossypium darwinii]
MQGDSVRKFPLDLKRRGSSPNQIGSPGQGTKRKGRAPFPVSHPLSPAQPFRTPFALIATRETGIQPSHDEGTVYGGAWRGCGGARARAEPDCGARACCKLLGFSDFALG